LKQNFLSLFQKILIEESTVNLNQSLQKNFVQILSRGAVLHKGIGINSDGLIEESLKVLEKRNALVQDKIQQNTIVQNNKVTHFNDVQNLPLQNEVDLISTEEKHSLSLGFGKILGAFLVDALMFICLLSVFVIVSQIVPFPKQFIFPLQNSIGVEKILNFFQGFNPLISKTDVLIVIFSYIFFAVFQALCGLVAGCTLGHSFFNLTPLWQLQVSSPKVARITLFFYLPSIFIVSFGGILALPFSIWKSHLFPYFFQHTKLERD
jgi:hypothetical protein